MDGFERRRLEKKEAILNAAQELFKQYGVNKVSIADIARRASVSQVSIYNYFESKENLKKHLLKKLWDNYYDSMMYIINSTEPLHDKIKSLLLTIADYSRNYTANFMTESIRNQLESDHYNTTTHVESLATAVFSLLEQGKEEKVIKNTISTNAMVSYIEIFRYYFINNPEAALKYDKNPELLKEMILLFLTALFI